MPEPRRPKLLRPVHPNVGVRALYRKRLLSMIEDMQRSVVWWLRAEYRAEEPRIAADASPARELIKRIRDLSRYWIRRWRQKLEQYAEDFVRGIEQHTRRSMLAALRDAGMTVRMDPSRVRNNVVQALIQENVSLIKTIPRQYFSEIEGMVMRGVTAGRDVAWLEEQLASRYGVTQRRAKLIARDQTNKATQAIERVEAKELGITEGIWVHVPGTKYSRKTHMEMNGKRFKLDGPDAGLYDSAVGRRVLPGELVACNCVFRSVIPEFGD